MRARFGLTRSPKYATSEIPGITSDGNGLRVSHVLSKIRQLLVTEAKNLVITPMLDEDVFDEDSVDLRLGTYFLLPQIPPQPFVDPTSAGAASQSYLRLHTPLTSLLRGRGPV